VANVDEVADAGPVGGRVVLAEDLDVASLSGGHVMLELLPRVSVGYIGLERDEETAVARIYYNKLPKLEGKVPLLLDPMLATGGSAAQALDLIKEAGGVEPRFICVVAAPEGVKVVEERHPEVHIYAAALDEGLNSKAYIVPGLGDFGDRLFGTGG